MFFDNQAIQKILFFSFKSSKFKGAKLSFYPLDQYDKSFEFFLKGKSVENKKKSKCLPGLIVKGVLV